MVVPPDDVQKARDRLAVLRGLVDRYRRHIEEGASRQTMAAYLQAIHAAEAEIAEIERRSADIPEEMPPKT